MSVEGIIGDASQRYGLKLIDITRTHGLLRTTVSLPGTEVAGFIDLGEESLLAARGHETPLVMYEVRACREMLVNEWLFQQLRELQPDLVWLAKGRECPRDRGHRIVAIDRAHWMFHCSGEGISVAHEMPERIAFVFSGLIEVHHRNKALEQ